MNQLRSIVIALLLGVLLCCGKSEKAKTPESTEPNKNSQDVERKAGSEDNSEESELKGAGNSHSLHTKEAGSSRPRPRPVVLETTGGEKPSQTLAPTTRPTSAPAQLEPLKIQLISVVGDGVAAIGDGVVGLNENRGFGVVGTNPAAAKEKFMTPVIEINQEVVDCLIDGRSAREDLSWRKNLDKNPTASSLKQTRFYRVISQKEKFEVVILDLYGREQVIEFQQYMGVDGTPAWKAGG